MGLMGKGVHWLKKNVGTTMRGAGSHGSRSSNMGMLKIKTRPMKKIKMRAPRRRRR